MLLKTRHVFVSQVEELDLLPITDPSQAPEVIHGTYRRFWPSIQKEGLSRMKRNHIHFAPGMPGKDGVISGGYREVSPPGSLS
jgi:2'-phosphotransferase